MQEHSHNFDTRDDDSNNFNAESDEAYATLVSPRFDADDARHAHPVVPLDAVRASRYGAKERAEEIRAPVEVARGGGEVSKGEDEGRRDHGERGDKHRKHEGDERESREGLKHSGKKVPRLVDVITGPPR